MRCISIQLTFTLTLTYDAAAGALACARRRNDVTRSNGIDGHDLLHNGPLCANMTSSVKPEVHNMRIATAPQEN